MNVGYAIDPPVQSVPDRVALFVDGEEITYRRLETLIRRSAAALEAAGVGPGDRVAVVNLSSALSVATIFAAARLGAASAQMNAYLTAGELGQLTRLVGARVGVAGARFADRLASVIDGPVLDEGRLFGTESDSDSGTGDDTDETPPGPGPGSTVGSEDAALILFTSGTTGLPKPIAISHAAVADRLAFYSKPIDPAATQLVDMMSAPIFHIAGTLGLFISLHQGKQMVMMPTFDAGQWLSLVEERRVTQTFVVPTMLARILDHPDFASTDLGSLKSLSYGAAAAPVNLVRRAVTALDWVDFSNTFGQTETLGAYAALTPDDHRRGDRFGSVGRPLAGVEVAIVDPVSGAPVARGEVGEFLVRAEQNTTAEWLHTGDIGSQDDEGYLYLAGRISDTINRGGEKFGPVEVEEVLRTHPAVVDVGVVGVPDPELGERVGAVVVTSGPVSAPDLVGHCAGRLATYKAPELVVFADDLPITALGKLDRTALRALLGDATRISRS